MFKIGDMLVYKGITTDKRKSWSISKPLLVIGESYKLIKIQPSQRYDELGIFLENSAGDRYWYPPSSFELDVNYAKRRVMELQDGAF